MASEINLLTPEKKHERKMASFFIISLCVLIFTVFVTILMIFYVLFLKTNLSVISKNQENALSQLKSLGTKRVELLTTKERLLAIRKILSSGSVFSSRLSLIASNVSSDISIDTITTDANSITVSMKTANLSSFNSFLNNGFSKMTKDKKSGIKKIEVQSFSISRGGNGYDASIQFMYNSPFQ